MAFEAKIKLSSDTSRVDAGIASVQKKLAGLSGKMGGAIAGLFSVGLISAGVKNMMDFADGITESADRMQITTKRVQELQMAAKLAGKDLGMFEKAFVNIENAAQAALGGNSTAMNSFNKLGVTEKDLRTLNKDALLNKTLGGASGMGNKSDAQMLLQNLVGSKGNMAGTLLGNASNILDPSSMGVPIVDSDTINALADAADNLELFIQRLKNEAMPVIVDIGNGILDFLTKMKQGMDVVSGYIVGLFSDLSNSPALKAVAKLLSGDIKGGLSDMGGMAINHVATQAQGAGEFLSGKKSFGDAFADTGSSMLANIFGKSAVKTAEETAASMAQDALDADAQRAAQLKAIKDARLAKENALTANVDRTGKKTGSDKNPLDSNMGGPAGVSYGNLIGINANYRLESLSQQTNNFLEQILATLKLNATTGTDYLPPTE